MKSGSPAHPDQTQLCGTCMRFWLWEEVNLLKPGKRQQKTIASVIHTQYSIKWHGNCLYSPKPCTPIITFFLVKFLPTGILNVTVYILDEFHWRVLLLRQTILWHQFLIRLFPQTHQGVLPEICWWYKSRSCAVSIFYYSLYASL